MISPARSLTKYGFDVDFDVAVKRWMAVGGDFSALGSNLLRGSGTIDGSEPVYAPLLSAAGIPPNSVHLPFQSTIYTDCNTQPHSPRHVEVKASTRADEPGSIALLREHSFLIEPSFLHILRALLLQVSPAKSRSHGDPDIVLPVGQQVGEQVCIYPVDLQVV